MAIVGPCGVRWALDHILRQTQRPHQTISWAQNQLEKVSKSFKGRRQAGREGLLKNSIRDVRSTADIIDSLLI